MAKNQKVKVEDPIKKELETIKKLIILFLLKSGSSQNEIASVLNVDQSVISRMISTRKIKQFDKEK